MTSAISPPTSQSPATAPSIALPATTPSPAVPAQQKPSYANATRPSNPSTIATPSSSTGAQAPVQHGKLVDSTPSPSMSAPASATGTPQPGLANGNPSPDFQRTDSHARKPSVMISAQGASGQIPNGGPVGHNNARHNIAFGSLNNGPQSSPSPAVNPAHPQQGSSLPAPRQDPRITSPAHSPSPIPQPPASGGKPPPALHGQGNGLVFGSSGVENGDARAAHNPLNPGAQPAHLRRESSQSGHSDLSGAGIANMNRGYMPPNGRGRGNFVPNYANANSPHQGYRQLSNQKGPGNMQGQFPGQAGMGNAPYRGRGSPSVMHVQPQMPQNMPQQMQYGGYQQHLGAQQYGGMYGMPYDPNAGYYQPYYPQHGFQQGGAGSPRPGQQYPSAYGGPPSNMASPYHPPPSMSRSVSQVSERPASSLGSRPPTNASNINQTPSTPASTAQSTAPTSSNFQIPARTKSKAIVIKNAAGEEVTFEKKASPAPVVAPAPPKSPAVVATPVPTPPPRTPSAVSAAHSRTESRSLKSSDEVKNDFQEQVRRKAEEDRKKALGDGAGLATDAKSVDDKSTGDVAKAEDVVKDPKPADAAPTEPTPLAKPETAAAAESDEDKAARLKREEDERLEREIAEMEALEEAREREEQEREKAYQEKKKRDAEERKKGEAAAAAKADEEMKRLEREAEELEEKREKERENPSEESDQAKADRELFNSLKKPTLGPGSSDAPSEPAVDETATASEPASATGAKGANQKAKPAQLKLRTDKPVEPAQPTPGMQALKSARLLDLQKDNVTYPEGIQSPNPALNQTTRRAAQYDRNFLLQFQNVFKEKPTVDWDQKVKETLGDGEPGSARPSASRQSSVSMGSRQPSQRGPNSAGGFTGAMGSFGGPGRTLPPGTTSAVRFEAANQGLRPGAPGQMGGFGRPGGAFPMGQTMSRQGSLTHMGTPPSPRPGASRGKGSRRGPDRAMSKKEEEASNKSMPLTAGLDLKPLEKSNSGWTARSIAAGPQITSNVGPDGMMPPDMVQRKVKAALNKMTPEKFDKISDQIMEISNQSKNESDGRTLRQVIQLTFEKACDEAHWAGMYAKFCQKMLVQMSNEIVDETITKNGQPVVGGNLFRKYLLNRCQEEFERGWEANLPDKPEGETEEAALLSEEYYIAAAAKRRGLGLIQFIGELYKLGMLTYRIMHQCVLRLLDFEGQPDESNVENLSRLLRTVGATMDNSDEQGHRLVNAYFDRIKTILDTHKDMPSRPRFMLMDVMDLRKNKWQDKAASKGPKTIQEIHAEAEAAQAAAEAERQRQNQRGGRLPAGRGDARSFSSQGMPPPDYPRNQVGVDDLRRLQNRGQQARTTSSGLGPSLGPGSSLYAGRTGSGRKGLGPPKDGDASGNTSRTNTPPIKKEEKDASAQANSFSALAALDAEGGEAARSPPSEKVSPAVVKATPSIDAAASEPPTGA